RPLLVSGTPGPIPSDPGPGGIPELGATLVASVEGLSLATLERTQAIGQGPVRLVLTRHRGLAMGLHPDHSSELSLGLNGETQPEGIVRLSIATKEIARPSADLRPATPEEAAGLTLARLGGLIPAVVAVQVDPTGIPLLREHLERREFLQVTAEQVRALA